MVSWCETVEKENLGLGIFRCYCEKRPEFLLSFYFFAFSQSEVPVRPSVLHRLTTDCLYKYDGKRVPKVNIRNWPCA